MLDELTRCQRGVGYDAQREIRAAVHLLGGDVDLRLVSRPPPPAEAAFLVGLPLAAHGNDDLAEQLVNAVRHETGQGETIAVPFGTDAAQLAADGIPSVVFGPGSIEQAHTKDEWIELKQLAIARDALCRAALALRR